MKKRYIGVGIWLMLACILYFFENNAGTRVVLFSALLLPLFPAVRRSLLAPSPAQTAPRAKLGSVLSPAEGKEDAFGFPRAYRPGDPINRIHWKLSAKKDELLVRETAGEPEREEREIKADQTEKAPSFRRKAVIFAAGFSWIGMSLLLLFLVPAANQGARALLNRLFAESEAVNAYVYARFTAAQDQPVGLAAALLGSVPLCLAAMAALSGSRGMALGLMAGAALFQAYFGLSFPPAVNVPLFMVFFLMLLRPWKKKAVLTVLAVTAALSLAVALACPGVDGGVEAASEDARDWLSQMAQGAVGASMEEPGGESEARRAHTQSRIDGDQAARAEREFRLLTVAEEKISMPRWTNALKTALLLLAAAALVTVPFLPFWLLARKRKKALEERKLFEAPNASAAVFAIFQRITAWLEAAGKGAGNLPYAQWEQSVSSGISPAFAQRFAQCERLFEEAAYSAHEMGEEARRQAMELLEETKRALWERADWKGRLRLLFREWLWG